MELSKRYRLMLAFVSWENPLIRPFTRNVKHTDNNWKEIFGISSQTLDNWELQRTPISDNSIETVFKTASKYIDNSTVANINKKDAKDKLERYRSSFGDESVSIYDAVAILGMSVDQCQKIFDEAAYRRLPVFPSMYYDGKLGGQDAINAAFAARDEYIGLYDLYLKRTRQPGGKNNEKKVRKFYWLHCSLRVRYLLEMGSGVAIRCKVNLPVLPESETRPDAEYWEYDGFLVVRSAYRRLFWMFEQRLEYRKENDFLYFVTDKGRKFPAANDDIVMVGSYLTTGQGAYSRDIIGNDVLIRRRDNLSESAMEDTMKSINRVIFDDAECSAIEKIINAYLRELKTREPT